MIYKIVPGPTNVTITKGNWQSACDVFAQIINTEARDGWKFVSMETITTSENQGCLSNNVVYTNIYMLIFVKEA